MSADRQFRSPDAVGVDGVELLPGSGDGLASLDGLLERIDRAPRRRCLEGQHQQVPGVLFGLAGEGIGGDQLSHCRAVRTKKSVFNPRRFSVSDSRNYLELGGADIRADEDEVAALQQRLALHAQPLGHGPEISHSDHAAASDIHRAKEADVDHVTGAWAIGRPGS